MLKNCISYQPFEFRVVYDHIFSYNKKNPPLSSGERVVESYRRGGLSQLKYFLHHHEV